MNELTIIEANRLTKLECQMERDQTAFVRYGNALLEIRESRLYRQSHATFEDYCLERWQLSKPYATRLIQSAKVASNLVPMGTIQPTSERQVRPIANLEPKQQREVWQKAVETAPKGKVTAAHVERVKKEFIPASERIAKPSINAIYENLRPYFTSEARSAERDRSAATVLINFINKCEISEQETVIDRLIEILTDHRNSIKLLEEYV
jgi:cobalamin biosynthesis Mg chelatase CobN